MNEIKIVHPFDECFFLLEARLHDASIYFFFEDKLEIIIGIEIPVANEVEMIERTDEGHSELLELLVDAFLEVSQRNIKLDMI